MKLISYNVNGVRSAMSKGLVAWLRETDADIVCFQELKAVREQIDEDAFRALGYEYLYWHSAEKKGYSGTAVLCKAKPESVQPGMNVGDYDREGRVIRADFGAFTLVCSYFPSGTTGNERQAFKMRYLEDFTGYITALRRERPNLIITGDFNICHKPIDINHPERHETVSGFLPEERAWFDSFIGLGFVDTFRVFNQQPEQYSWWSFRSGARSKNLGWRIDYFLCTESLRAALQGAAIHPLAVHSDHCPVSLEVKV
ncbi:MAG: exodeoxyribonuclease III [Prevotellaceae bacterium]|jgi:exodeoxyribonuclease-3|nr:exodeoxyribonuclease III [Prevotellaceae bacterium]